MASNLKGTALEFDTASRMSGCGFAPHLANGFQTMGRTEECDEEPRVPHGFHCTSFTSNRARHGAASVEEVSCGYLALGDDFEQQEVPSEEELEADIVASDNAYYARYDFLQVTGCEREMPIGVFRDRSATAADWPSVRNERARHAFRSVREVVVINTDPRATGLTYRQRGLARIMRSRRTAVPTAEISTVRAELGRGSYAHIMRDADTSNVASLTRRLERAGLHNAAEAAARAVNRRDAAREAARRAMPAPQPQPSRGRIVSRG